MRKNYLWCGQYLWFRGCGHLGLKGKSVPSHSCRRKMKSKIRFTRDSALCRGEVAPAIPDMTLALYKNRWDGVRNASVVSTAFATFKRLRHRSLEWYFPAWVQVSLWTPRSTEQSWVPRSQTVPRPFLHFWTIEFTNSRFSIPYHFCSVVRGIYNGRRDGGVTSRQHPRCFNISQGCPLYLFLVWWSLRCSLKMLTPPSFQEVTQPEQEKSANWCMLMTPWSLRSTMRMLKLTCNASNRVGVCMGSNWTGTNWKCFQCDVKHASKNPMKIMWCRRGRCFIWTCLVWQGQGQACTPMASPF